MRLAAAIFAVSLLLVPAHAMAHAKLKSSAPAANAGGAAGLKEIRLEFAEEIEPSLSKFELDDASGMPIVEFPGDKGCVKAKCKFEVAPLAAGAYTFNYHVLSGDGHVVDGKFGFTVTGGAG